MKFNLDIKNIIPTLKEIKDVCSNNTEYCINCPFYIEGLWCRSCFFNFDYDGTVPEEWDFEALVNQQEGE